jgi:hypothetical protein
LIDMGASRHEGGADILGSPADLYIALGVRLRERVRQALRASRPPGSLTNTPATGAVNGEKA